MHFTALASKLLSPESEIFKSLSHETLFYDYNDIEPAAASRIRPPADPSLGGYHMLTENLIRLADKLGWQKREKENLAFGLFNNFPFTVVDGRNFKAFITPVAGISQQGLQALHEYLTSQTRALKLRNYEFNDNFLCVRVKEPLFSLPIEKMELILGQLSGILSEYDMPKTACVVCGEPASKRGLYFGLFAHLHSECTDKDPVDFTTLHGSDESGRDDAAAVPAESAWIEESDGVAQDASGNDNQTESAPAASETGTGFRDGNN